MVASRPSPPPFSTSNRDDPAAVKLIFLARPSARHSDADDFVVSYPAKKALVCFRAIPRFRNLKTRPSLSVKVAVSVLCG
jgi:hypothetical protein